MFADCYRGKRVLVTGITGFKGSWLGVWLTQLGAHVAGLADGVPTTPSHFEAAGIDRYIRYFQGDIRDRDFVARTLDDFRPEVVFHLAAQALVRRSYADPVRTFEVNSIGSLNVLEAVRHRRFVQATVMITSDKCYQNVEWVWGYRETDHLGGDDPYSASKAAAENIFRAYARSFYKQDGVAAIATARAGNVIGGGDWADDRVIPDCVRAWSNSKPVVIRNPSATRPWQHVLEPLSGYLTLGAHLYRRDPRVLRESYNFGPDASVNATVLDLMTAVGRYWPSAESSVEPDPQAHESHLLKLSCDKALADLRWLPTLTFDETVRFTAEWYRTYYERKPDMLGVTVEQIDQYCRKAAERMRPWALQEKRA